MESSDEEHKDKVHKPFWNPFHHPQPYNEVEKSQDSDSQVFYFPSQQQKFIPNQRPQQVKKLGHYFSN